MISAMLSHFSLLTVKSLPALLCSVVLNGLAPAAVLLDSQSQTITIYTASGTRSLTFNQFDTLGGTRVLTGVTVAYYFDKIGGSYFCFGEFISIFLLAAKTLPWLNTRLVAVPEARWSRGKGQTSLLKMTLRPAFWRCRAAWRRSVAA